MSLLQANTTHMPFKDTSVQLCCFSPPYWGLRKYEGLPALVWGGNSKCEHVWETESIKIVGGHSGGIESSGLSGNMKRRAEGTGSNQDNQYSFCQLCGAWRGDLGLEPTPELYLDHMMLVMAEVWRVLRDDGVCFVNIGDSYASQGGPQGTNITEILGGSPKKQDYQTTRKASFGIKPKSLCLIPQKFAIRCQEAGWIIRSEIIWAKPNPMPESVKDRPTRSHEQVWMMTKRGKYFWDKEASKEPVTGNAHPRGNGVNPKAQWKTPDGWDTSTGSGGHGSFHKDGREKGFIGYKHKVKQNPSFSAAVKDLVDSRNIRSVWTIPTEPTPDAHFASWPTKLVNKMVLAASAPGDVVLDPFCGTGKTVVEAERLNRLGIGLDLSWQYLSTIAMPRVRMPLQKELI